MRRDAPATAWRDRFRHEIAAVLAVKLLLLIFLKFAFFSHPQSPHGGMPSTAVARSLLDAPSAPPL